jgi:hypothetical protein
VKNYIKLKSLGSICFNVLLLTAMSIQSIFADSTQFKDVKTTWTPSIKTGQVILEVTNNSEAPIHISPYLNMVYELSEKDDLASFLTAVQPKTISAAVIIMEPHSKDLVQVSSERGQLPKPVEVGAGETKKIEFAADQNLITLTNAKNPTAVRLCLFLEGKPISITKITISNGDWK